MSAPARIGQTITDALARVRAARYFRTQRRAANQQGHFRVSTQDGGGPPPNFAAFTGDSGPGDDTTFDGRAAHWIYEAKDITGTNWIANVGVNLPEAGAGNSPVVMPTSPFTDGTSKSVQYKGGKYHEAPDTSNTWATQEAVIRIIFGTFDQGACGVISTSNGGSPGTGIDVYLSGVPSGGLYVQVADNAIGTFQAVIPYGTNAQAASMGAEYGINDVCIFIKPNAYLHVVVNGVITATDATVGNIDLSSAGALRLGSSRKSPDGSTSAIPIVYAGCWIDTAWLGTTADCTALAKAAFYDFANIPTSATFTRASAATIATKTVGAPTELTVNSLGLHWPRYSNRIDANGDVVSGYLGEAGIANNIIGAGNWAFLAWTGGANQGTRVDNALAGPFIPALTKASSFAATAVNDAHFVEKVFGGSPIAPGTKTMFCSVNKPGSTDWIIMMLGTFILGTSEHAYVYFDIANGVKGTSVVGGAPPPVIDDYDLIPIGDGYYLCWLVVTNTATNINACRIYSAPADNVPVYVGDGSVSFYNGGNAIFSAPVNSDPTSLFYSEVSNIQWTSRTEDLMDLTTAALSYNETVGTLAFDFHVVGEVYTQGALFSVDDGTANNQWLIEVDTSNRVVVTVTKGGVVQATLTSTATVADNLVHAFRLTWTDGALVLYVDDAVEDTDPLAAANFPTGLTRALPGYGAGSTPVNPLISALEVWDSVQVPTP